MLRSICYKLYFGLTMLTSLLACGFMGAFLILDNANIIKVIEQTREGAPNVLAAIVMNTILYTMVSIAYKLAKVDE